MQRKATDQQILQAISDLTTTYSPTMQEIADRVGLKSTSTIHRRLKILESKGYIKNTNVIRGVSLTDKGRSYYESIRKIRKPKR